MIIDYLSKYSRSFDYKKTELFREYRKNSSSLKEKGYDLKIKSSFDLYKYQIIMRTLENETEIITSMKSMIVENDDLIKYLNYQERRNLYRVEMSAIVAKMRHLQYDSPIYLPCFDRLVNGHFLNDYETLSLKKYQEILNSDNRCFSDMFACYGYDLYSSEFCDLKLLDSNDELVIYYSKDFEVMYIIDKNDNDVIELVLKDKWFKGEYPIENIRELGNLIVNDRDEVYSYLLAQNMVSAKFVKKMEKKLP